MSRMRGGRRARGARGAALVEFVIASFIGLLVVLALGRIVLMNARAWGWGRDKAELQANATEALEGMARSVREARRVVVDSPTQFRTYDSQGNLVHTYSRQTSNGELRLREDDRDLSARTCTQFSVTPDNDTTSLTLKFELQDRSGDKVAVLTRAARRNIVYEF
jgi:hypothetical protein